MTSNVESRLHNIEKILFDADTYGDISLVEVILQRLDGIDHRIREALATAEESGIMAIKFKKELEGLIDLSDMEERLGTIEERLDKLEANK